WEPWGLFRKPIEGTVADNLRAWGTGGLRRLSSEEPLKDVIQCSPTRGLEKEIASWRALNDDSRTRKRNRVPSVTQAPAIHAPTGKGCAPAWDRYHLRSICWIRFDSRRCRSRGLPRSRDRFC